MEVKDIPQIYQRALRFQAEGKVVEAHNLFNEIIAVRPHTAEAHFQIGKIARQAKDYTAAEKALSFARRLKPKEIVVLRERAEILSDAGRLEEAVEAYREIIKLMPQDIEAIIALGFLYQRLSNFDAAENSFRKALRLRPEDGEIYRSWLQGQKLKKGAPVLREMLAVHAAPKSQGLNRAYLCFALAKGLDESGESEKAFRFLKEGNALFSKAYPFDRKAFDQETEDIIASMAALDYSAPRPALDNDAFAPIIITGLPRSGTTLVEQIVASHSLVGGGGELAVIPQMLVRQLHQKDKGWKPASVLTPEQIERFPTAFERELHKRAQFERRVSDKTITNFQFIGLIKTLVPNARIILVRRDPRDQLFSMYRNVFSPGTHIHSYDMKALAHYYKGFTRYVDFWREHALGDFTEVIYEDLVNDPEVQVRRLIEAAGLEWEEACLEFHKTKRDVKTLSIHQVRQPMYKNSANAWEKYADGLKPMIDALEENGSLEWHLAK